MSAKSWPVTKRANGPLARTSASPQSAQVAHRPVHRDAENQQGSSESQSEHDVRQLVDPHVGFSFPQPTSTPAGSNGVQAGNWKLDGRFESLRWHDVLRELHVQSGAPGVQVVEKCAREHPDAAPVSKSTVSKLLRGEGRPRRSTVEAFVLACLAYAKRRQHALPDGGEVPKFWLDRYDGC